MLSTIDLYPWVILPALIFIARVMDVSLGTVRVIFITRGMKYLAPLVGFIEIFVWLLAIGQIMQNLSNPACYLAYAFGFATGCHVGIIIGEKLSLGMVLLRIITSNDPKDMLTTMNEHNYGVTTVSGKGAQGDVQVVFTVVQRKDADKVIKLIKSFDPNAFYSIEEVAEVNKGVFPAKKNSFFQEFGTIRAFRKGK